MLAEKKVVILGAGIGGLSCAWFLIKLCKEKGIQPPEITLVEKNKQVGGQARADSSQNNEKTKLFNEYCWHAVGSSYEVFCEILSDIGVLDNLRKLDLFHYFRSNQKHLLTDWDLFSNASEKDSLKKIAAHLQLMGKKITWYDWLLIHKLILIGSVYKYLPRKVYYYYDKIKWMDYTDGFSEELKKWIQKAPGIYLGMEVFNLSADTMFNLVAGSFKSKKSALEPGFYSFCGPIDRCFLSPFVEKLKENDVQILTECQLVETLIWDIKTDNQKISKVESVTVKKLDSSKMEHVLKADYYVNSLPVEVACKMMPDISPDLAKNGKQIQFQILFFLSKKLKYDKPAVMIYPDTEFFLMTRVESNIWAKEYFDLYPGVKEILSVGIGVLNEATLKTPRLKLVEKVWNLLISNLDSKHNITIGNRDLLYCNIWDSFGFPGENKSQIDTFEPKFSNSVGTLKLRPGTSSKKYTNLFHATGYTDINKNGGTVNLFNMETSATAGKLVAAEIINNYISDKIIFQQSFKDKLIEKTKIHGKTVTKIIYAIGFLLVILSLEFLKEIFLDIFHLNN